MQIGDEIVHRLRFVAQAHRRDREALLEPGNLAVKQFPGPVDARDQYEMVFHSNS